MLLCLLTCLAAGCAYMEDRGRDFADCFRLSVGAGRFGIAHAKVCAIGTGVGLEKTYRAGIERKGEPEVWKEEGNGFLVCYSRAFFPESDEPDMAYAEKASRSSWSTIMFSIEGPVSPRFLTVLFIPAPDAEDFFWIEGGAGALVGIRAGFNIAEFADFLLGWGTLDIFGDDGRGAAEEEPEERPAPPEKNNAEQPPKKDIT